VAHYREAFVGIDVAKLKNAIAVAEFGRDGEIRYFGEVEASDVSMRRVIQRIAAKFDRVCRWLLKTAHSWRREGITANFGAVGAAKMFLERV
jgi:hypothetical protein